MERKRVVKKKVTKVDVETEIKKLLDSKNYTKPSINFNVNTGSNSNKVTIHTNGKHLFYLKYDVTEYDNCCGMREIGNIGYADNSILPRSLIKKLIHKSLTLAIENEIDKIDDDRYADKDLDTINTGKLGYSVTLPYEKGEYRAFMDSIIEFGFKNVGEFKNRNSGNNLRHYILI